MQRFRRHQRATAQALVEFALAATLLFTLLAAAVDLGFIFFTLQGLRGAAQEGAVYGSYPFVDTDGSGNVTTVDFKYDEIVKRIRQSSGDSGAGFADLYDLNNDGIDDLTQGGVVNPTDPDSYIYIENLRDVTPDNDPTNDSGVACRTDVPKVEMRDAARGCYIRVTVRYNYRFIFPLAPAFADEYQLHSTYLLKVRSTFIG